MQAQQVLMKELVTACFGDKEKAIRLIEYERKLNPTLTTLEATESALDRLCYDRGKARREAIYDPEAFRRPSREDNSLNSSDIQKEQGPPNVGMTMFLSVALACAVVFGFVSIASKSLRPNAQPALQLKSLSEPESLRSRSSTERQITSSVTSRESAYYPDRAVLQVFLSASLMGERCMRIKVQYRR